MSMPDEQVSVADLRFALYKRPPHPELFRIEHRQDIRQGVYWASVWLIDGGHIITFCWKNNFMVEILAGADSLGPRTGLLQQFPLRGEKTCRQSSEEGLHYVMAGQVERMSRKVFDYTYQDIIATAQSRGTLVLRGQADDLNAPFAYAEIDARNSELHITTCHAFPEDLAMARTQSVFKAALKPQRKRSTAQNAPREQSSEK